MIKASSRRKKNKALELKDKWQRKAVVQIWYNVNQIPIPTLLSTFCLLPLYFLEKMNESNYA